MHLSERNANTKFAKAAQLTQKGKWKAASALYQQILQDQPNNAGAWHLLGLTSMQQGKQDKALEAIEKAIALDPNQAEFHNHAGVIHFNLGNLEQGISCLQKSLALKPQSLDCRYNLALGLQKAGRIKEAKQEYQTLIIQNPKYVRALVQLGIILQGEQQYEQAIAYNRQAVAIQPNNFQAWCNLAVALQEIEELTEAETSYQKALKFQPQYVEALNGLGTLLEKQGQATNAIAHYQKALTHKPNFLSALLNLAKVKFRVQQWQEAAADYRKILDLVPQHPSALNGLLGAELFSCRWEQLPTLTEQIWQTTQTQPGEMPPFHTLYLPFSAQQQQVFAENLAQGLVRKMASRKAQLNFTFEKFKNHQTKIKLGYVSGDFRNHAVAQLMLRLFELHDRSRFEVFAYSLGPDDGSEYRQKLMSDCDCFREISNLTPTAAAQQIYDDNITILIDLAGYTEYAAPEVFALQPAPLQVNYLGYPGTLGAEYMDYIVTDPVLTPEPLAEFLTEKCIYLPGSYQINNNQQPLPEKYTSRAEWGLPEDAFVFCCFNKSEKIEPEMFATWMQILKQVEHSVLWLLDCNPLAQENLTKIAESSGIAPERLIFAPRVSKDQHLTRHTCADLFLDTLYYNAHTTGSDALWAGLPLITVAGKTFASRVAASLLTAVELPQLIANNLEEYAKLAIHYATHPEELQAIKQHLQSNRLQLPLFDTVSTVKYLESGYLSIWENYLSGNAPKAIALNKVSTKSTAKIPIPKLPNTFSAEAESYRDRDHKITCKADNGFISWLAQSVGSLAISTYQAGKVAMVGWNGLQVTLLLREFSKPMGMALDGDRLALATKHQVILLANAQNLSYHYLLDQPGRYDALYLPRANYFTGDLNVHDLGFGDDELWLVNTRFSCLAKLSTDFSFVPHWQPPFISQLVPEDRCHLNGLAMVKGKPKYVTALGVSDEVGGWRANKSNGGIIIDVETNEILVQGLSMPHSPRWHQGALWFLNSGQGELCRFDPKTGESQAICTLPGFGRGLCMRGDYALMGLCQIRETNIFGGLPIQEKFPQLLCGVAVVNCRKGELVGLFEFTSGIQELYEIQFFPGKTRPTILNSEEDAVRDAFTAPDFSYWLRPEFLIEDAS
ncbi:MAG: TIGR03032 family protein [Cyanobacteria bacterium P01_F01_bin.143]